MIYAKKKQGESNERLISRFKQLLQRSRIILRAKKGRFHKKKPTKAYVRKSAVMRASYRAKRAKKQYYS